MVALENDNTAILVVDDEESLRLTFQMFLAREGYGPVEVASTYDEALALIDKQDFDLVVSDIVMEGASGIDLLRTIKEKGVECPVVMVTGYPNINTAAEAVRLGAFDYLAKPVKKEDLLRTARMALQQYALRNANNALAHEKERYQKYLEAVFRSVPELIFTVDPQRRIIEFNDNVAKWVADFGIDDISGKTLDEVGACFELFSRDVDAVLADQEEVPEHRIEFTHDSGQASIFRVSAVPLVSDEGVFLGVVLVARDVSRFEALEKRDCVSGSIDWWVPAGPCRPSIP